MEWLTTKEAAEHLGVKVNAIYDMIERGDIRAHQPLRIGREELDEDIKRNMLANMEVQDER